MAFKSQGDVKKAILDGMVYINDVQCTDPAMIVNDGEYIIEFRNEDHSSKISVEVVNEQVDTWDWVK